MRYKLPTDKLVNQLVPYFLHGRRYILFIQSLVFPLMVLNKWFVNFAKEKQIEARMTSQTVYFEWYLNYKFRKYIRDSNDTIFIKDSQIIGVDMYHEIANYQKPCTIWYQNEQIVTSNQLEEPRRFYYLSEEKLINKVSFMVCVPSINIAEQEFVYMLSFAVNKYKLAGMTYLIKIDTNEFTPNKRING